MRVFDRFLAAALAALLVACGGGGEAVRAPAAAAPSVHVAHSYQVHMMVRGAEYVQTPAPAFDASATFAWGASAQESVALQLQAPGRILVFPPLVKNGADVAAVEAYAAAAAAHRDRVEWVYVYDELFWEHGANGWEVRIGAHEAAAVAAAHAVRRHGLKAAVSIDVHTVLSPGFRLQEPDAFDVIGVVLYPSARMVVGPTDCPEAASVFAGWLQCSVQRLRATGFTGEVWYVVQSFVDGTDAALAEQLHLQYEAILAGPELGVVGIASFGYLVDFPGEPPLARGQGSAFDRLFQLPMP